MNIRLQKVIATVMTYIQDTDNNYYQMPTGLECFDIQKSLGILEKGAYFNVVKYVIRYKTTRNVLDLYKAIHYLLIMIAEKDEDDEEHIDAGNK